MAAMMATVVAMLAMLTLYHHQSDQFYIPIADFLGSFNLAAPPLLALVFSYVLTFLLGEKVSDAPKLVIKYLRNVFLQHRLGMVAYIVLAVMICLASSQYIRTTAPRHYVELVSILLGGEQDRQQLIAKEIKAIAERSPDYAEKIQLVVDVFALRRKWNFHGATPNTTEPRILVRALDANVTDEAWKEHPLRKHALAEAYSMWAQAETASRFSIGSTDSAIHLKNAVALYDEVSRSPSPLATPLLKISAVNNTGNAYLYTGRFADASKYYMTAQAQNKNLSSAGNLIAALILQGKYPEAEKTGEALREWGISSGKAQTEGSAYSGVVGNMAFAYLIEGKFERAAKLMLEAYDLESDELNALNLASALFLLGKPKDAWTLMNDQFKYPPLELKDQAKRAQEKYNGCYYIVAAAMTEPSQLGLMAAYYNLYLGHGQTQAQLEASTPESLKPLTQSVVGRLETDNGACKNLMMIPAFRNLILRPA
ncbi:MAG TPA: hypothetical protein VFW93_14380 [Aquabacterium sp.]|uniref:hypothetical protein n=1 Tax=Aquabacterium sp. TaxID=1872578 RepID=UPI002E2F9099|nr:hypothetical protein [Aquabacterium sp.]HEX5357397.1 hypothetical protein [Aquabacterium sp.]